MGVNAMGQMKTYVYASGFDEEELTAQIEDEMRETDDVEQLYFYNYSTKLFEIDFSKIAGSQLQNVNLQGVKLSSQSLQALLTKNPNLSLLKLDDCELENLTPFLQAHQTTMSIQIDSTMGNAVIENCSANELMAFEQKFPEVYLSPHVQIPIRTEMLTPFAEELDAKRNTAFSEMFLNSLKNLPERRYRGFLL